MARLLRTPLDITLRLRIQSMQRLRRNITLALSVLLICWVLFCTDGCSAGHWKVAVVVIHIERITFLFPIFSKEILTFFG